jgi:hypothetical protein
VEGESAECPAFEGTLMIAGPDGDVMTLPITSADSQRSNWLHECGGTGYLLTMGRQPSLGEVLVRGQSYRLVLRFEESLPEGCSLWFSSMCHIPILGNEGDDVVAPPRP